MSSRLHTVKVCKKPFRELNHLLAVHLALELLKLAYCTAEISHPVMPCGLIPVTELSFVSAPHVTCALLTPACSQRSF